LTLPPSALASALVRDESGRSMRVMVATVTAGGGHLAAAAAMDEAWRALRPQDTGTALMS
jgi:hypothetical protein